MEYTKVRSAKQLSYYQDEIPPGFMELGNQADIAGYELIIEEVGDSYALSLQPENSDLPEIELVTIPASENRIHFTPTLTFPVVNMADEYVDYMEYLAKQWLVVARFVTQIMNFVYDPSISWNEE